MNLLAYLSAYSSIQLSKCRMEMYGLYSGSTTPYICIKGEALYIHDSIFLDFSDTTNRGAAIQVDGNIYPTVITTTAFLRCNSGNQDGGALYLLSRNVSIVRCCAYLCSAGTNQFCHIYVSARQRGYLNETSIHMCAPANNSQSKHSYMMEPGIQTLFHLNSTYNFVEGDGAGLFHKDADSIIGSQCIISCCSGASAFQFCLFHQLLTKFQATMSEFAFINNTATDSVISFGSFMEFKDSVFALNSPHLCSIMDPRYTSSAANLTFISCYFDQPVTTTSLVYIMGTVNSMSTCSFEAFNTEFCHYNPPTPKQTPHPTKSKMPEPSESAHPTQSIQSNSGSPTNESKSAVVYVTVGSAAAVCLIAVTSVIIFKRKKKSPIPDLDFRSTNDLTSLSTSNGYDREIFEPAPEANYDNPF